MITPMIRRWDLAAVASVAAWATSVLLVNESAARRPADESAALRQLCLTAAGVATAVLYIERSRMKTLDAIRAEIRDEVRAERRHSHLRLIETGRKMGAAEAGRSGPAA